MSMTKKKVSRFKVGQLVALNEIEWPEMVGVFGLVLRIEKGSDRASNMFVQFFPPDHHMWNKTDRYTDYIQGWWPKADYFIIVSEPDE